METIDVMGFDYTAMITDDLVSISNDEGQTVATATRKNSYSWSTRVRGFRDAVIYVSDADDAAHHLAVLAAH